MKIKFALCGLVILLFAVVILSYYINKEGFETQTKADLVLAAVIEAKTAISAAKTSVFAAREAIYKLTGTTAIQLVAAIPDTPATATESIKTGRDEIPAVSIITASNTPSNISAAYTAVNAAKTAVETAQKKIGPVTVAGSVAAAVDDAKLEATTAFETAKALLALASAQNTAVSAGKTDEAAQVKVYAENYLKSIEAITIVNINDKLTQLSGKLATLFATINATQLDNATLKTNIEAVTESASYIVPAVNALQVTANTAVNSKKAANAIIATVNGQTSAVRIEVQTDHDDNKFRIKAKAINATGPINVRIFDENGKSITPLRLVVQPNIFTELYSGPESKFNDGDTYNIVESSSMTMPSNAVILGSFTYSKSTGSSAYPSWFQHSPQGSWSDGTWGIDGSYNPRGTGAGANTSANTGATGATATGATGATATTTATGAAATPQRNDVVSQVGLTDTGYNAMELQQRAELLKDIQKMVKNEMLASRCLTPATFNPDNLTTTSLIQGEEYGNNCHKENEYRCPKNPDGTCPPIPDMTDYIKKDSIPCWGCNIDY